ncbi:hypothetical protein REPUB_Repub03eG0097100 [Reevesia pubescens]
MIRDLQRPKPDRDLALGELLRKKANEGVKILMLVWDDRTSVQLLKEDGVITRHYFHDTKVHCVLCPRDPDNLHSIVQDSTMFIHHQKIEVVDSELLNVESNRRIVSFIGGINLTNRRYDTASHPIFRTLDTDHHADFRQPCFHDASIAKGGPREPWHDMHCRLEGPVAWDVLFNFEQRWRKLGEKGLLVHLQEMDDIFIPPSPVTFPEDHETWMVELPSAFLTTLRLQLDLVLSAGRIMLSTEAFRMHILMPFVEQRILFTLKINISLVALSARIQMI